MAYAASDGNLSAIKVLLKYGAQDDNALVKAAEGGHSNIVHHLLHHKMSCDGALVRACQEGHEDVVTVMLEANESPDTPYKGKTPRQAATVYPNILRMLIQFGAKSNTGDGALYLACWSGHEDAVEILLTAGENPNTPYDSETPAEAATAGGFYKILELLCKHGAEIKPEQLIQACKEGNAKMVMALLEGGEDPDTPHNDETPRQAAATNGHPSILHLLLKHGAKCNTSPPPGRP